MTRREKMRVEAFDMWKEGRPMPSILTCMVLQGRSRAKLRYIRRWVEAWDRGRQRNEDNR